MNKGRTFKDYRSLICIEQVVKELGYVQDLAAGKKVPAYVLKDGNIEIDKVYITNKTDNDNSLFWRRNPGPGRVKYGDVIEFIRENLRSFSESAGARNEVDAINKICQRLSNTPYEQENSGQYMSDGTTRVFDIKQYDRLVDDWEKSMRFFQPRGIDASTVKLFKDNFELIRDEKNPKMKWHNLGFPYRRPGEPNIVGYEIRGFGKYKSKAEGTDSTLGCWTAYLGKTGTPDNIPTWQIKKIHLAESAYDAISYVQLNKGKLDFETEVFVSVGGTFTNAMMVKLLDTYPAATPVLHFDNDMTGVMYDIRVAAIKAGVALHTGNVGDEIRFNWGEKAFSIPADKLTYKEFIKASGLPTDKRPEVVIEKAPEGFKDWNEILQTAFDVEKETKKYYNTGKESGTFRNPAPNPENQEPKTQGMKR